MIQGTLIDVAVIMIAGLAGLLVGKSLNLNVRKTLMMVLGLLALATGLKMVIEGNQLVVVLVSISFGVVIGDRLGLDRRIVAYSNISTKQSMLQAAIAASVLSLAGPLAILGPINEGLGRGNELLLLKAGFDAVSTVIFAASMGIGVLLSAAPVLFIQGAITVFSRFCGGGISNGMLSALSGVGGVMIIAVGLDLLEIKNIPVVNMLPALCVAPIVVALCRLVGGV